MYHGGNSETTGRAFSACIRSERLVDKVGQWQPIAIFLCGQTEADSGSITAITEIKSSHSVRFKAVQHRLGPDYSLKSPGIPNITYVSCARLISQAGTMYPLSGYLTKPHGQFRAS